MSHPYAVLEDRLRVALRAYTDAIPEVGFADVEATEDTAYLAGRVDGLAAAFPQLDGVEIARAVGLAMVGTTRSSIVRDVLRATVDFLEGDDVERLSSLRLPPL